MCRSGSLFGLSGAEKVSYARGSRNAKAERNRVDDLISSHDDRLRSQRDCAQPPGSKGNYLESEPLRTDVDNPENSKTRERHHVREGTTRSETTPTLLPLDEDRIQHEQEETQPVRNSRCEWRTKKTHVEFVNEEPIEQRVERRGDQQDVCSWPIKLWFSG